MDDLDSIVGEIMRPEMREGESRPYYAAKLILEARRERDALRAYIDELVQKGSAKLVKDFYGDDP